MKSFIIIFFFCFQALGQSFKFDIDSFLLGAMDDYGGRMIALKNNESARYIGSVRPELSNLFLDSIVKRYNTPKKEILVKGSIFYNAGIANEINKYYNVEIDSGMAYVDEMDKEYFIYIHHLNEKKFDTCDKKLSFLTGMFYNCGRVENDNVIFETANSFSFSVAVHFISNLGFRYCENFNPEYNIPTIQIVTFQPPQEYFQYFATLESKRKNGW